MIFKYLAYKELQSFQKLINFAKARSDPRRYQIPTLDMQTIVTPEPSDLSQKNASWNRMKQVTGDRIKFASKVEFKCKQMCFTLLNTPVLGREIRTVCKNGLI